MKVHQEWTDKYGSLMSDAADFAILATANLPDFRRFPVTKIWGLHTIYALSGVETFFPFLLVPPCLFYTVIVFILGIVSDCLFLLFLILPWPVVFHRTDR